MQRCVSLPIMDFASQLQTCQKILKQLLEEGKEEQSQPLSSPYQHPVPYDDLSHHYSDKFDQINSLTNQWIASTITCLENFGITNEILLQLIQLSFHTPIILRFQAIEKTQFLREIERKYDLKTNQIVYEDTHQNTFDRFFFKKYKIIKEYEWKFQLEYQVIILFNQHQPQSHHSPDSSNDHDHDNNQINLFNFTCQHIFTILKNEIFRPEMKILPDQDVDITWLLHQISPDNLLPTFEINRLDKKCYTPRRNPNIESVINFLEKFTSWSQQVVDYFRSEIFPLQIHYNPPHTPLPNMGSINTEGIFKPILPFYIGQSHELVGSDLAVISSSQELVRLNFHLPTYDELNQFKAHHTKTIYNKFIEINSIFPLPSSLTPPLLNAQTVNFLILLIHMNEISQLFSLSINSIENNLFKQFIKAIGKEIQPVDFRDYMIFHTRKLFLPEYQMKPFCYSIRKSSNYTPDGTISILDQTYPSDSSSSNHIYTFVDHQTPETSHLMSFPINAAVSVSFKGDRYLHGYLRHSFGTESLSTDNDNSSSKSHIFRLNSVGTVSSLSFDNAFGHGSKPKYYCGRFVGRYPSGCDSCDGYCGPSNGCQCDSCAQLVPDEDISSGLLVRCPNGHLLQEVGYANNWVCDATGEGGCLIAGTQTNSRLFTKVLRYRCTGGCDFDYCYNCHQQKIQQNRQRLLQSCSPLVSCPLGHPLDLSNLKSPWYCDHSREIGGCPTTNSIRPSNGFEEFHHIVRWRCKEGCDFDYCDACYTQKYQQIYRPLPKASSSTPSIPPQILLTAQSRQYCTFILLLGRITSANTFDPKHAILLQNKDSINIPLELEIIPSLKEFNDLISSLSKKQQEFLQAYRSMQLESSLFGICLIPIKPLLEKVLNMPEDSLLKEIELTERILKLFLEYEIPSSILSYDGK